MQFLTTEPLWLSGTLLLGVATLLAMASPVLVRRRVSLDWLRLNNEVAGFKFATVGELYTVLLAFAMIVVWEKFSEAESAVTQEAGAPATLYRLADGIGGEPSTALRDGVTRYLREAIAKDWPAMERGGASHDATRALEAAYAALLTFTPSGGRGTALLAEALDQLHVVTQARRVRLVLAPGVVPGVLCALWRCCSDGRLHPLLWYREPARSSDDDGGVLSFLIFSGLLVVTAIDEPFAGVVKLEPEALAAVLEDFGATARP